MTPPQEDLDTFATDIRDAVSEGAYEVVFSGGGDAEAMALSLVRDRIGAAVPYGPHESFVRALDKLELARAAAVSRDRDAGGPPRRPTRLSPDHAGAFVDQGAPPRTAPRRARARRACRPTVTADRAEAAAAAERMRQTGGGPLLQEAVVGTLMAFCCVRADGAIFGRSQQRCRTGLAVARRRQRSRARTITVDPRIESGVLRLLAELDWSGVAELQFLEPAHGRPQLIDFNGRFYGSLELAVSAGANLPAVWAAAATGRPLPQERTAQPGYVYQWLESDLRRALAERRGGLAVDVAGTLGTALPPTAHSITSRRDPRPLGRALGSLARRGLRRRRQSPPPG